MTNLKAIQPLPCREPEVGRWLWALQDTRSLTYECLEGISQAELDWSPPYQGNSIGSLLYHIAAIEADWLYEDVLQSGFPADVADLFTHGLRDEVGLLSAVRGVVLEEHLCVLDAVRARLVLAYSQFTLDEFRRPRRQPDYLVTPEWTLHHLIQHEAEHRGQIMELRNAFKAL
jgi:uncharacterized damage-inducible protein DinB